MTKTLLIYTNPTKYSYDTITVEEFKNIFDGLDKRN